MGLFKSVVVGHGCVVLTGIISPVKNARSLSFSYSGYLCLNASIALWAAKSGFL